MNAIITKYRFLANKNIKFWKLNLVIFLRFWSFEPHFLINFFLIKQRVYTTALENISLQAHMAWFSLENYK